MNASISFKKTAVTSSVSFALALIAAVFIGKGIVTDTTYYPVGADLTAVSLLDSVAILAGTLRSTAIQLALIFIAGSSLFCIPITSAVCAYRGIALGYTTASVHNQIVKVYGAGTSGMKVFAPVLIIYFTVSALMIAVASLASAYSETAFARHREGRGTLRYVFFFLCTSGLIFILDMIKILFL